MTREQLDIDRLCKVIEEATTVGHTLAELIEELRTDLVHAVRNREQTWEHVRSNPNLLSCDSCKCDSPASLEEALHTGWIDVGPHDGDTKFIGTCGPCF